MEKTSVDRTTLLTVTIVVEAALLLLATIWSQLAQISLALYMVPDFKHLLGGIGAGLLMASIGLFLFWLGKSVSLFSQIREIAYKYLVPLFAEMRWIDLVVVAVLSGFCEEVFFRGIVQAQFGLFVTALAFGLFHDPTFRHISYSIMAFLAGLFLGWLYMITGNLWVPITAHVVHNLISLFFLRYQIKPPDSPLEDTTGAQAP
jgi:membrane protease YdiL (CAAX protease family)